MGDPENPANPENPENIDSPDDDSDPSSDDSSAGLNELYSWIAAQHAVLAANAASQEKAAETGAEGESSIDRPATVDPFRNAPPIKGQFGAQCGKDIDCYRNMPSKIVEPISGNASATDEKKSGKSGGESDGKVNFGGGSLSDARASDAMSCLNSYTKGARLAEYNEYVKYERLGAEHPIIMDNKSYARVQCESQGFRYDVYVNDRVTPDKKAVVVPVKSTTVSPPAPYAPTPPPLPPTPSLPSYSEHDIQLGFSADLQAHDFLSQLYPPLSNGVGAGAGAFSASSPQLSAPPMPTPDQRPAPVPVPDWTTQTEWAFQKAADPRFFDPVTSVDTGNRPLNFILNKVLLPWRNAAAALDNVAIAAVVKTDEALKRSPFAMEYQAAQHMMPLGRAMGIAMELGEIVPALEYSANWLATNQQVQSLIRAPAFWATGAGLGGSIPRTLPDTPAQMLRPEIEASLPSTAEQAATMFQDVVRRAEAFLRDNPDLVMQLGKTSEGEPISFPQLWSAARKYAKGDPSFARLLAGNAMEAMVNAIIEAEGLPFTRVSGAYRIDFHGIDAFREFTFELTTEADVARHALRDYMQKPGAMIFTYIPTID